VTFVAHALENTELVSLVVHYPESARLRQAVAEEAGVA
jgi:hypothetical protein